MRNDAVYRELYIIAAQFNRLSRSFGVLAHELRKEPESDTVACIEEAVRRILNTKNSIVVGPEAQSTLFD